MQRWSCLAMVVVMLMGCGVLDRDRHRRRNRNRTTTPVVQPTAPPVPPPPPIPPPLTHLVGDYQMSWRRQPPTATPTDDHTAILAEHGSCFWARTMYRFTEDNWVEIAYEVLCEATDLPAAYMSCFVRGGTPVTWT